MRIPRTLLQWYLPLGLVFTLVLSLIWPNPGDWLSRKTPMSTINVTIIFLITGLQLSTDELGSATRAWPLVILGTILILGITPLISPSLLVRLPLQPIEFPLGLALFAVAPTTVSSGVIMCTQCGGSIGVALMLTLSTNLLGVISMPLFVKWILDVQNIGQTRKVKFDTVDAMIKLLYSVVAPLVIGKWILRRMDAVRGWATENKQFLSFFSSTLIIMIPWMKSSESVDKFRQVGIVDLIYVSLCACVMHAVFWLVATVSGSAMCAAFTKVEKNSFHCCNLCSSSLSVDRSHVKSLIIMVGQKTLVQSLSVLDTLPATAGSQGVLAIPMILGHLMQLVMDGFVVAHWSLNSTERAREVSQLELEGGPEVDYGESSQQ